MATLREIRNRLRSVENIRQITKAMEMVAASRLQKAQSKAEQSRPYNAKMQQMLDNLAAAVSSDFRHPLFEKRSIKKVGLVIVAADRGLCGSYNANVFSAADKWLAHYPANQVELFLIGRKAIEHYKHQKWVIRDQRSPWGGKITFPEIKQLTYQLMDAFLSQALDEIWLVYTQYVNLLVRPVRVEKFLNIERPQRTQSTVATDYIFEPNAAEIYAELLPRYCVTKIQTVLNEAYAAELAARIFAMKTATKNAEDMINSLTLVRNKVRQAGITKEMLEITAGAQELK